MSRWGNSRELTKSSYDLVKQNPEMNRYAVKAAVAGAVIGGIGSLVGVVLLAVGDAALDGSKTVLGIVAMILGAIAVVGAVIAGLTAANLQLAALVSATDDVLHGRPLDHDAARSAAHAKLGTLVRWSAISVAVGALVGFIRGDSDNGIVVQIVRTLLAGIVASLWAIVTTLVLPIIVLEQVGTVAAIKRSASIIRGTWGESVFGTVRIGARFGLVFALPGTLLLAGGIALGLIVRSTPAIAAGAVLAVVGVGLIFIGAVKAATCRNVFGIALYRWATGDGALGPFTDADLRGAVRTRGGSPAAADEVAAAA
ncbi:DUF6159 family protein [Dermatobacter hominis]|uniref:DUF6159 family protein n=1 Tax=Dermatobacter hominis TaxID=2884263 RepID=UPI001D12B348|nr:DUF6159 family protein [Dermatobacter hominis]UDY34536.1 DUF6159 family protein [Dermatobacter hominis]